MLPVYSIHATFRFFTRRYFCSPTPLSLSRENAKTFWAARMTVDFPIPIQTWSTLYSTGSTNLFIHWLIQSFCRSLKTSSCSMSTSINNFLLPKHCTHTRSLAHSLNFSFSFGRRTNYLHKNEGSNGSRCDAVARLLLHHCIFAYHFLYYM